jgi:hypothetical protein
VNTSLSAQLNKANLSHISDESRKHFIYQAKAENFQLSCGAQHLMSKIHAIILALTICPIGIWDIRRFS